MLYGGEKKACDNLISKVNCTDVQVGGMDTYNRAAFMLYLFTFGGDLETSVSSSSLEKSNLVSFCFNVSFLLLPK